MGSAAGGARACLTSDPRPRQRHQELLWAYHPRFILYLQDRDGDENWHLFAADVETGTARDLIPYDGVHAVPQERSDKFPEEVLIRLNRRDPSVHDLYRVNILTGAAHLGARNDIGADRFVTDRNFNPRLAVVIPPDGGTRVLALSKSGRWEPFMTIGAEDSLTTQPLCFDADGHTLYLLDSRGRDTSALVAMDLEAETERELARHPRAVPLVVATTTAEWAATLLPRCLAAARRGLAGLNLLPVPYDQPADWSVVHGWAERAREAGLGIAAHAGEFGALHLAEALEVPGLTRIGHAVGAGSDPRLLDRIAARGVTIECALSSNVVLGAVASYECHPLRRFVERGIPVAICTDDPVRACTTIGREYAISAKLGFSPAELRGFTRAAVRASFCDPAERYRLLPLVDGPSRCVRPAVSVERAASSRHRWSGDGTRCNVRADESRRRHHHSCVQPGRYPPALVDERGRSARRRFRAHLLAGR